MIDYFPFGDQRLNESTGYDSHRTFTDHLYDAESDLTYMKARYYSDIVRRFMSQDPASLYGPEQFLSDPQQLNLYSYVRNNPLAYTDPTGLAAFPLSIPPIVWVLAALGVTLFREVPELQV
ncbi:MAG: RHS repeat-associated core domain-containing protein [Bacteroidota bacterium]